MTDPGPVTAGSTPDPVASWRSRARRSALWSATTGLAILLACAAVAWTWFDELPTHVASHWSRGGAPDGFMAPAPFVLLFVGLGACLCALFVGIAMNAGAAASTRRTMAGASVWMGGFLGGILLGTLAPQRGLTDAGDVALPGLVIAGAVLVPLVPAAIAAALVPGDPAMPASENVDAEVPRAPLGDSERAAWLRRAVGGPGVTIGACVVLLTAGIAVVTQTWAMIALAAGVALILAAMLAFLVRADETGLTVRSALGWPRTHVPAAEILRASVVQVRPLADFGGWGWRVGHGGRVGVVLRSGDALLVERTGGRSFVVTVDDAEAAAALLNTMAERAR